MKNVAIILIVIFAAGLIWVGCGGGGDKKTEDTGEPDATSDISYTKTPDLTSPPSTTEPSPTAPETEAPGATVTPLPSPTQSPLPTVTPPATSIPTITPTPSPSPTQEPGPTPTGSPTPLPSLTPPADGTVSFSDSSLEVAIRDAIGKPGGNIQVTDLAALTTLNASNSDITSIAGLEYCTSLTFIDLSHNNIENILPLVRNSGLGAGDTVHIEWNPLDSASYSYVTQLKDRGVNVIWGSL